MSYNPYPPQSNPPTPPGFPPGNVPPAGYPPVQPPAPQQPPQPPSGYSAGGGQTIRGKRQKIFYEEKFKHTIAILMALITALTSLIALAQNAASSRGEIAGRDSQVYALEATSMEISGTTTANATYYGVFKRTYFDDNMSWFESNHADELGATRYQTLRNDMENTTELLNPDTYLNPDTWTVDYDAFVVDTYYVKTQELKEKYLAAAGAKQQWDFKVSTNNLLITLNAIALFLLGLSVTISGSITRGIFSRMGMVIAVGVSAWGALNFFAPVKDLRDFPGAIEAYAQASGYSYRGEYTDAVTKYDEALLLAPDYARAYRGRGDAYYYLDDYKAAITDLEKARQYGDQTFGTGGNLGWYYYLDSRFADAIQLDREIVAEYPGELWIRFNLAVTLLADGQVLGALDEYEQGMVIAEQWVADAQSSGNPVPVTLWWSLRVAPLDLDGLIKIIDTGEGFPVFSSLKNTAEARTEAEKMIYKLRTLENGLELTGKPPQETTTAVVSPFEFGEKVYDENDAFLRYDKSTVWDYGTKRVYLLFDYTGFKTGQETMYKVYLNGDELRMWRYAEPWPLGEAGSAEKLFRYFDSDDFIFSKGDYVVELYIDNILVQRGTFSVVDASG